MKYKLFNQCVNSSTAIVIAATGRFLGDAMFLSHVLFSDLMCSPAQLDHVKIVRKIKDEIIHCNAH